MRKSVRVGFMLILSAGLWRASEAALADKPANSAAASTATRAVIDRPGLPPERVIPPTLPASVEDPLLLQAWVRLYHRTERILLWHATTISGHDLARYLLDQAIPLVWDEAGTCQQGSCSRQFCMGATCTYEDGQPGVDPIYVRPSHGADMPSLVATLAHEIFHRTQPFGPVPATRFEEYWAFWIEAQLYPDTALKFDGYDPLVAGYLPLWIRDNGVAAYYALPDYPATVAIPAAGVTAP